MTSQPPPRVWVTRDEGPDGPLCTALRSHGLTPVLEPVIARRALSDARDQISALGSEDWLVLTSAYAAGIIAADAARCRLAVVGEATAAAARHRGLRVDLIGPDGTGAGLWRALADRVRTGRVCFPRSSLAAVPPGWASIEVAAPIVYETAPATFDRGIAERIDIAAVTSASAAKTVTGLAGIPGRPPCASIGPTTSEALRSAGAVPWIEAAEPSFTALAHAIAAASQSSALLHPSVPRP